MAKRTAELDGSDNGAAVVLAPPAKTEKRVEGPKITLPRMAIETVEVKIVGVTPLICHNWSKKSKQQMLDKQMGVAKAAKEKKNPNSDYWESLYHITPNVEQKHVEGNRYGFPAIGFKAAAVTACTSVDGITKVQARQAFHVQGFAGGDLVEIIGVPTIREDMVRVGMGTADIRFRAEFKEWYAILRIEHNANVLTAHEIFNLFKTAGFSVGVGEWRPERDGSFGRFDVA